MRIRDKCRCEKVAREKGTWLETQVYIKGAYLAFNNLGATEFAFWELKTSVGALQQGLEAIVTDLLAVDP